RDVHALMGKQHALVVLFVFERFVVFVEQLEQQLWRREFWRWGGVGLLVILLPSSVAGSRLPDPGCRILLSASARCCLTSCAAAPSSPAARPSIGTARWCRAVRGAPASRPARTPGTGRAR